MDFAAVGSGLATAIGTVTANGETVTATELLPNGVNKLALLVYPPDGDLSFLMGGPMLNAHLLYPVRLLRDPLDVKARTAALLAWATVLWPKPQAAYQLGLGAGVKAEAQSIRIAIEGQKYGDYVYDVVELMVDVQIYELATFSP